METLPLDRARWPFIALIASAVMLATAHAFETFGGYQPCQLCLRQREVFWVAGAIAIFAIAIKWRGAPLWLKSALCIVIGAVFLYGSGLAGYHSLVEWKVLPAPDTCTAGALNFGSDPLEALKHPMHPPSCGDAVLFDPIIHLSMASWNAIFSLILAGLSFFSATRAMRTDTANERFELGEAA